MKSFVTADGLRGLRLNVPDLGRVVVGHAAGHRLTSSTGRTT
jgi:hypothetical protein